MFAKLHEFDNKTILAVCDKEHIGKNFDDGKIFFCAKEKFYKEIEVDEKKLKELLENSDSANLFGNKCVSIAEKQGLINETQVILVSGIKHAQIYMV